MFGYTRKQLKAMSRKQLLKVLESVDRDTLTMKQLLFLDSLLTPPPLTPEQRQEWYQLNQKLCDCYIEPLVDDEDCNQKGINYDPITKRISGRPPDILPPEIIKTFVTGKYTLFEPFALGSSFYRFIEIKKSVEEFIYSRPWLN